MIHSSKDSYASLPRRYVVASPQTSAAVIRQPPGFVREFGRQMFATLGATLPAPRAVTFVRTGATCGS